MSDPITPERLAQIKADVARATPGPWYSESDDDSWMLFAEVRVPVSELRGFDPEFLADLVARHPEGYLASHPLQILKAPKRNTPYAEYWPKGDDARFIANARTDVPDLVAALEAARAANRALVDAILGTPERASLMHHAEAWIEQYGGWWGDETLKEARAAVRLADPERALAHYAQLAAEAAQSLAYRLTLRPMSGAERDASLRAALEADLEPNAWVEANADERPEPEED